MEDSIYAKLKSSRFLKKSAQNIVQCKTTLRSKEIIYLCEQGVTIGIFPVIA